VKALDLVVLHPCACRAYGLRPGSAFPPGSWLILADGTGIVVMPDGQVEPRPTPLPWTRPSVAAIPTMTLVCR
jgi:hypothetical protein